MGAPIPSHPVDVVPWVVEIVEDVFTPLESLRSGFIECYRSAVDHGERMTRHDIARIRPSVLTWLRGEHGFVVGAGAIVAPGLLSDQPGRLEWWSRSPGEHEPAFLDVDLDPESLEFYDYACAEWYREPRATGRRHITGPHVDFGGTDRYILTFTLPVFSQSRFLGVVGADVPTAHLEARLLPVLIGLDREVALLNADRRVIASNSPDRPSGTLFPAPPGTGRALPGSPWRLLYSPGAAGDVEPRSVPQRSSAPPRQAVPGVRTPPDPLDGTP